MFALVHVPSPRMNECVVTFASRQPIDLDVIAQQHAAYRALLSDCGAEVSSLDVNLQHPDCVFVEDAAVVLDELAIVASLGPSSRRGEADGIEVALRLHRPLARIRWPATLEGGDVLRVGRTLLVGLTERTNALGVQALRELAPNYEVRAIPVRGCLHLKSACTALPDGRLLLNRAWLKSELLADFELVDVDEREPHAANVVLCGGYVCMSAAYPLTARRLADDGFRVRTVDLSEFAKADGSASCLSILVP